MEDSNLFNLSSNKLSTETTNSTADMPDKVYTNLPRRFDIKIGLFALFVILGLVGLLGNGLIHYFVSKKSHFHYYSQLLSLETLIFTSGV